MTIWNDYRLYDLIKIQQNTNAKDYKYNATRKIEMHLNPVAIHILTIKLKKKLTNTNSKLQFPCYSILDLP